MPWRILTDTKRVAAFLGPIFATVCMPLAFGPGCSTAGVHSQLAGEWQIVDPKPDAGGEPPLRIRKDGTFVLDRFSSWHVVRGDLRHRGDSSVGGAIEGQRNEVLWSEYTPTSSMIIVRSTWRGEGGTSELVSVAQAVLLPDGTAHCWAAPPLFFRCSMYAQEGGVREVPNGRWVPGGSGRPL